MISSKVCPEPAKVVPIPGTSHVTRNNFKDYATQQNLSIAPRTVANVSLISFHTSYLFLSLSVTWL